LKEQKIDESPTYLSNYYFDLREIKKRPYEELYATIGILWKFVGLDI
jgi:hypothetical protein